MSETPAVEPPVSSGPTMQVETCQMVHEEPYDFAYCETHDTTFALGQVCKFQGRVMWEVFAEEADEQRARAVRAEFEHDLLIMELAALAGEQATIRDDALARLAAQDFIDPEHQMRLSDAADRANRWHEQLTALLPPDTAAPSETR